MLASESEGHGDTVVFLHSFPLDRTMWAVQMSAVVRAGYRGIAMDLPGFGESTLIAAAPSMDAYAHAVVSTLDALNVSRAVFVGLSMGGYVALALAAIFPERVRALVLADTRATADATLVRVGRMHSLALVRDHGSVSLVERMLPGLLAAGTSESVRTYVRTLGVSQSSEALTFALLAMRDRPDRTTVLNEIRVAVMFVVGSDDVITQPAEMYAMAAGVSGARFERIEGAGHLANLEQPERFNHILLDFLRTTVSSDV
jgi:3-oxoadipate enol-lactonase